MKLSVILPVYNGMPFLPDAVKSLFDQTFQDLIIYAIDNGSTDGSKEYFSALNDRRIKYVRLEEKNLVRALNKGLELSDTPFIARMDSDDFCQPIRFQRQIDFLERNQSVSLVGSQGKYFGAKQGKIFNINLPLQHKEIVEAMLKSRNAIIHPSIMFRREIYADFGGYSESFPDCEDSEYFLRIGHKIRFANLPERLHYMRIRGGSIMTEDVKKRLKQYYLVSLKYKSNYVHHENTIRYPENFHLRFFKQLDIISLSNYRKGLNYYLNKNTLIGLLYFTIASLTNPLRFLRSVKMKVKGRMVSN